jgi:hypothetical protein
VEHKQARVTGKGREGCRVKAVALAVPQVSERTEAVKVEHPQGWVEVVTVFGVQDSEQASVAREVGDVHALLVTVQLDSLAPDLANVHAKPVSTGKADRYPSARPER